MAAVATVALALLSAQSADADILPPRTGSSTLNNAGQLRALENRIQRQQYQQQQQQYRDQDRSAVPLNRQTPQVPVMKPNCQIRIYGNRTIRDCR
ncbi:hypothetical protein ABMA46_16390 [Mesorhizobium sp. CN5-321]|uniref:hypothetical protein n=1 Tax=Mesorhizobium hunchu TaxID=3157708 RepID=UPI0032B7BEA0